jgi:hypothetical protein
VTMIHSTEGRGPEPAPIDPGTNDLGMSEEIGHFLPTTDAERADAPALKSS